MHNARRVLLCAAALTKRWHRRRSAYFFRVCSVATFILIFPDRYCFDSIAWARARSAKLGVGLDALEVVAGVAGVAQRLQPPEEELGVLRQVLVARAEHVAVAAPEAQVLRVLARPQLEHLREETCRPPRRRADPREKMMGPARARTCA